MFNTILRNTQYSAAVMLFTFGLSTSALAGGKNFSIMNAGQYKNQISFISDTPVEKINGYANTVTGSFMIDVNSPESSTGKIEVPVTTMKTGNSSRDGHMYGDDWLDAGSHPTITFMVKGIKDVKKNSGSGKTQISGTAYGEFTLHGVTKSIEAKVDIIYLNESDDTRKVVPGDLALVRTYFTVPLKDYNVKGKAGIVGKKVGESIAINATIFGASK